MDEFYRHFLFNKQLGQRTGQATMNALYMTDREAYDKLIEAGLDCFYVDSIQPAALTFIVDYFKNQD